MKTTLDLPEPVFRAAQAAAEADGVPVDRFLIDAIRAIVDSRPIPDFPSPSWMAYFGAFADSPGSRDETRRIQQAIDAEFGQIDPLE